MGISMADLDYLDIGMIVDIMKEAQNDDVEWCQVATQEDFDKF